MDDQYLLLRGYTGTSAILGREDFIIPLGIALEPPIISIHESASIWQATLVYFLLIEKAEDGDGEEALDLFDESVAKSFADFAEWLSKRDPAIFDDLRRRGIIIDVLVGGWIDSCQFDLTLPPAILLECGRRGLEISIMTNE